MFKKTLLMLVAGLTLASCASKKDLQAAEDRARRTQELLDTATVKLNACLAEEKANIARLQSLEREMRTKDDQISNLQGTNAALLNNVGNLATLSAKEAENLERSLESIKEKDLQIRSLNDAITKKDSVTLALVTSFKSSLGNLNDQDIEVNVEKGVVFISISDKLLYKSGSWEVQDEAKRILGKVAKVVNDKPDIEIMVEGHTDNQPISKSNIQDNWDLSAKRATSIVRILQDDYGVAPQRMTAAGRSFYVPVASNETPQGRAMNRRTRIVVLPKLDQFYELVEKGMEQAKANARKQ